MRGAGVIDTIDLRMLNRLHQSKISLARAGLAVRACLGVALFTSIARSETAPSSRPADADWPIAMKDPSAQRFSSLDQIKTENVASLKVAWTFGTGVYRGQESAPIVVGSTMYVVTPYPNKLYALDLANNGAMKWVYEPKP